jgi:hypothetical protein
MMGDEIPDLVASLVERAKISVPGTDQAAMVAMELRRLPGIDVIDPVHMRHHEYDIRFSMTSSSEMLAAIDLWLASRESAK